MSRWRIAVVGLGIGKMHLEAFAGRDDVEVCGLCDRDPRRLRQVGRSWPSAARGEDLEAMLRDEAPDAVVIATPNDLHEPMVLAALEAGCHVLVEKPLAHRLDSARRIAEAARRRPRQRVMIDLSFRFGAAARTAKAWLESGAAGRLYHAQTVWNRSRGIPDFGAWFLQRRRSGGGPIIDLAVHRLDLALWFLGQPKILAVSAMTHGRLGRRLMKAKGMAFDVEDLGTALFRLQGGRSLALECSWAENSDRQELMRTMVLGEEGGVVHRNIDAGYEFECALHVDRGGRLRSVSPARFRRPALTPAGAFVDSLSKADRRLPGIADGLRLAEALEALYRSAREGRELSMEEVRESAS